jgi:hypothetical protein
VLFPLQGLFVSEHNLRESRLFDPAIKADSLPLQLYQQVLNTALGTACRRGNVEQIDASLYDSNNANNG